MKTSSLILVVGTLAIMGIGCGHHKSVALTEQAKATGEKLENLFVAANKAGGLTREQQEEALSILRKDAEEPDGALCLNQQDPNGIEFEVSKLIHIGLDGAKAHAIMDNPPCGRQNAVALPVTPTVVRNANDDPVAFTIAPEAYADLAAFIRRVGRNIGDGDNQFTFIDQNHNRHALVAIHGTGPSNSAQISVWVNGKYASAGKEFFSYVIMPDGTVHFLGQTAARQMDEGQKGLRELLGKLRIKAS